MSNVGGGGAVRSALRRLCVLFCLVSIDEARKTSRIVERQNPNLNTALTDVLIREN